MTITASSQQDILAAYAVMPTSLVSPLRTLLVGADYAVRQADPAGTSYTGLIGNYTAAGIAATTYPSYSVSETVDTSSVVGTIYNGLVQLFNDTGTPTIANGRQYGANVNKIQHNAGTTIWTGTGQTVSIAVKVGDYIKLTNGSGANVLYTKVLAIEASTSNYDVLVLEDSLPATMTGVQYFLIQVAEIVSSFTVPVTAGATQVTFGASITYATARTGSAQPVIGGQNYAAVTYSKAYVSYRARRNNTALTGQPVVINSVTDLLVYFTQSDLDSPSSELAFAARRALYPTTTLTINSIPSLLIQAVATNDVSGYTNALDISKRKRTWASLVLLSTSSTIQAIGKAAIDYRNSDLVGGWSTQWSTLAVPVENVLVSSPANAVTSSTLTVTSPGPAFALASVGDVIRAAGVDYVIATKTSNQQVTTSTAITPALSSSTSYQLVHPYSTAEKAAVYTASATSTDDAAVNLVFGATPKWNGVSVEPFLLTAAVAGMRGYAAPHQSLKYVALESGWTVPDVDNVYYAHLDTMATAGVFVIGSREDASGAMVVSANTTDQTSILVGRESNQFTVSAVKRYVYEYATAYIGRWKVTNTLYNRVATDIQTAGQRLIADTQNNSVLGTVVTSWTVGNVTKDATLADKVLVPITFTISTEVGQLAASYNITIA